VDNTNLVNRALQASATRTNVTSGELTNNTSNEAIQANLILSPLRDELIRMAPWNFAKNTINATFITSAPGTPENPSNAGFLTWQKGIPAPPWAYEYQYPIDCARLISIVPQFATGFAGAVPITTAVTGGVPSFWQGPPVKFQIAIDQFFSATSIAIVAGGTGHAVGDVLTLATPSSGLGAPAQVLVTTIGGGGTITAGSLITDIFGEVLAGSYFTQPTNPVAQGSTTGVGTGATFNLTFPSPPAQIDQRVILCNQQSATLVYLKRVTDLNVMDDEFVECYIQALGAKLALQLTGNKEVARSCMEKANIKIMEARRSDGNEGLTINDVTPDWLRVRGISYPNWEFSPNSQFDWGPMFTPFG
jgi:hypothetical protein